ncbi:MAG: WD40/YVTN/BNR-like repeat-containing protein [Acidobacteriaceae bacterium]
MNSPTIRFRVVSMLPLLVVAIAAAMPQPGHAQNGPVPQQYFGGLHWRLIGPFRAGRVVAVAGVPGSSTDFYFGAVDGGVWRTADAGTVWKPIFDGQPVASIGALAVAPSNAKVLYAGTGESDIRSDLASGDGVYKSTDGGHTWKNVGLRNSRQISRIVIDPSNADVAYVGVLGHAYGPSAERGVYKTTDGGLTWKHVLDKGPDVGIADMAIANGKPNTLFAATWNAHRPPWSTYAPINGPGSGLYRSTDAGATWSQLAGHGLPAGEWGRVGVAVSPDGMRVYALIADEKLSGLYRSDDGGATWTRVNKDRRLTSRNWYFDRVTIDPSHPDVVYVPNVALYRSEDGGKTISIVRGAPGGDDYHELWVDPKNSARMILGVDQGTSISLDCGKTWSTWYNQATAQLYHVTTDNQFPYAVYGAQQDSGSAAVYSRTDHGQITPRDWFLPGGSESGYIAIDPQDPNIIYLTDTFGGVSRFNRKTSFSQNVSPWPMPDFGTEITEHKYRDPWTPVLVFSPADKKTLFLGTQYVMKTTDGGLHWQRISPDLTGAVSTGAPSASSKATVENAEQRGYGVVFTIAPSRLNAQEIWAGSDTGRIHLTLDGGATWKDVTPPGLSAWSKISLIEASHFDAGVAYAAVDRHRLDDYSPYIYRTQDYGKTWKLTIDGIPSSTFLRVVREDTKQRGLLYAGTEFGIYTSFDNGDHWQPLQLNLPVTSVRDIDVHGNDLVVATHGRSFWILDDMTPLRQAAEAAKASAAWLYRPATAMRIDNDGFLGTPLPPEEPTAKNPPNGAILDYGIKSSARAVTLTIVDSSGKIVRHFSSADSVPPLPQMAPIAERWFPKPQRLLLAPGMHRFVWDLAWGSSGKTSVDPDSGGDEEEGAVHGPRVVPGTYQVQLTVDGKKFIQPLRIVMDPRSSATSAVLQQQQEIALRIFAGSMRSRQAMAEIQSVQKGLQGMQSELAKRPDLAANVHRLDDSIRLILAGVQTKEAPEDIGLTKANTGLASALAVVESGDRTIPAQAMELYRQSSAAMLKRVQQWQQLKAAEVPQLNRKLQKMNFPPLEISKIEKEVDYQMTR